MAVTLTYYTAVNAASIYMYMVGVLKYVDHDPECNAPWRRFPNSIGQSYGYECYVESSDVGGGWEEDAGGGGPGKSGGYPTPKG